MGRGGAGGGEGGDGGAPPGPETPHPEAWLRREGRGLFVSARRGRGARWCAVPASRAPAASASGSQGSPRPVGESEGWGLRSPPRPG